MSRGLFRKVSFAKTVGAYRSLWKRTLLRLFFPGYGMKGMGWLRDPKKALYNWIYHRTSISLPRLLGYKPSLGGTMAALFVASLFNIALLPVDTAKAASKSGKIKKAAKERGGNFGKIRDFKDDVFHEPRQLKTRSEKKETPRIENQAAKTTKTIEISKAKQTKPAAIQKSPVASKQKAEASVRKINHEQGYIPISDTKLKKITTAEIVANTYGKETKKPVEKQTPVTTAVSDENTPKSTPRNKNDQYIRKRMMISDLSYCSSTVTDGLSVGSVIDITADPDNAGAAVLSYNNEKIGYVPQNETMPILTCIKLGRNIYGIISDKKTENGQTAYEFEVWFG